jgi:hypothetical protein
MKPEETQPPSSELCESKKMKASPSALARQLASGVNIISCGFLGFFRGLLANNYWPMQQQ